jgi:Phage tail tube protein, GTA-gp10
MANRYRGEIPFELDGQTHCLRLTLGSLANLEDAMGADGLRALGERLQTGRLSAREICEILAAGFAGAGEPVSAKDLGQMIPASAFEGAATAAALLLAVTFGAGESSRPSPPQAA